MNTTQAIMLIEAVARNLHTSARKGHTLGPDALDFIADELDYALAELKELKE